jgi:hypothetical protein
MWDFPDGESGGTRYLVLGFGSERAVLTTDAYAEIEVHCWQSAGVGRRLR